MNAYVMRDQARPLKTSMLRGAASIGREWVIEVKPGQLAVGIAVGVLLGYLLWAHRDERRPTPSPFLQRFELRSEHL